MFLGVFFGNFEHISHLLLVFPLLTLNKFMLAGRFNSVIYKCVKFLYNLKSDKESRFKVTMEIYPTTIYFW